MTTPTSPSSVSETPEIAENPTEHDWVSREATVESLDREWTVVTKDSTEPSEPVSVAPPIPRWVKIAAASVVLVLILVAVWLGLLFSAPSPSDPVKGPWPLKPPKVFHDWVSGGISSDDTLPEHQRAVVKSQYSNGKEQVVLVLSRPEKDLDKYLRDTKIGKTQNVGSATCGYYTDAGTPVCVRIVDNTGILLGGLTGQSFDELSKLTEDFYSTLREG